MLILMLICHILSELDSYPHHGAYHHKDLAIVLSNLLQVSVIIGKLLSQGLLTLRFMDEFQGVCEDHKKINFYIHSTAIAPISGFPLKEINENTFCLCLKHTQPLLTVPATRHLLTCCSVHVYYLNMSSFSA